MTEGEFWQMMKNETAIAKENVEQINDLALSNVDEKFLNILGSEKFPLSVKENLNEVLNIVNEGKTLIDLYPEVLAEIPVSSSGFQDVCVQYQEHHTPHRKLRQAMLEMGGRLEALNTAKSGFRKAYGKLRRMETLLKDLEEVLTNLKSDRITKTDYLVLLQYFSKFLTPYHSIIQKEGVIEDKELCGFLIKKVEDLFYTKMCAYQELLRGYKSSKHMVKDAALKVAQQRNLVEIFKKQVEETGWSFEESEVIYYVMYFTSEMEKQLRTMGRVDTGTFGVIRYLPEGIRKKVLENRAFLEKKLFVELWPSHGDYLTEVYKDFLMPKFTGENEIEGVNVKEFISLDLIKILARKED
jgi:hypothetical protein